METELRVDLAVEPGRCGAVRGAHRGASAAYCGTCGVGLCHEHADQHHGAGHGVWGVGASPWQARVDAAADCCGGTGLADYAAVPCPNPACPVAVPLL